LFIVGNSMEMGIVGCIDVSVSSVWMGWVISEASLWSSAHVKSCGGRLEVDVDDSSSCDVRVKLRNRLNTGGGMLALD
jgi:hypothetical protein